MSNIVEPSAFSDLASKIVRDAMADRSIYDRMSKKEGEIWGRALPAREAKANREADQKAAAELRLNRNLTGFVTWALKKRRVFEKGLSIGCGEGRFERDLMRRGVCKSFVGYDVAEGALNDARAKAKEEGVQAEYRMDDINFAKLPEKTFDLVVAQTSLHHVLHLEHVAEQVSRAMVPGGIFWIFDYIGESQFQYDDARIEICNEAIAKLPARFRYDRVLDRELQPITRRKPGTLASPFESIRSADIKPVFLPRFEVVEAREAFTILHLLAPVGTRAAYNETDETRAMFEMLFLLDRTLQERGVLTPTAGQYILTH